MRLLAALLIGTLACHARSAPGTSDLVEEGSVTVKVVNNNALDVILYVVHDAHRDRLGQATARMNTQFVVNFRTLGAGREFYLLADPVGSREPVRSELLHPLRGQVVTWTLETDFRRSTVTVF